MSCVESIEKELSKSFIKNMSRNSIEPSKKLIATGELMATAVHDLKNPLASIRGTSTIRDNDIII